MSGLFVAGLLGTIAFIFLNQKNDSFSEMTTENLEEYM